MTYELTVQERDLRVGCDLIANDGALLFRDFDNDMRRHKRHLRLFTSCCRMPGNLLMLVNYVVSFLIGIDPDRWIVHKAVSIGVQFMQIDGVNITYMDTYRRPG